MQRYCFFLIYANVYDFFLCISRKSSNFALKIYKKMPHNTEIERKFLLKSNAFLAQATRRQEITQGYLCRDKERTIRVRICNEHAF